MRANLVILFTILLFVVITSCTKSSCDLGIPNYPTTLPGTWQVGNVITTYYVVKATGKYTLTIKTGDTLRHDTIITIPVPYVDNIFNVVTNVIDTVHIKTPLNHDSTITVTISNNLFIDSIIGAPSRYDTARGRWKFTDYFLNKQYFQAPSSSSSAAMDTVNKVDSIIKYVIRPFYWNNLQVSKLCSATIQYKDSAFVEHTGTKLE